MSSHLRRTGTALRPPFFSPQSSPLSEINSPLPQFSCATSQERSLPDTSPAGTRLRRFQPSRQRPAPTLGRNLLPFPSVLSAHTVQVNARTGSRHQRVSTAIPLAQTGNRIAWSFGSGEGAKIIHFTVEARKKGREILFGGKHPLTAG